MAPRSNIEVRVMRADEFEPMRELAAAAFGHSDQIRQLLDLLHTSWAWEDDLAFVAERDGDLLGQVLYTHAFLDAPKRLVDVLVLSPVAVRPDVQGTGIGAALTRETLATLRERSEPLVFLEGHPHYSPRFGFEVAGACGYRQPSGRTPDPAFMVLRLPRFQPWMTGQLVYPDAFWRTDAVGLR